MRSTCVWLSREVFILLKNATCVWVSREVFILLENASKSKIYEIIKQILDQSTKIEFDWDVHSHLKMIMVYYIDEFSITI